MDQRRHRQARDLQAPRRRRSLVLEGFTIEVHVLRQQRYERTDRSSLFPDLDLVLLCSFLDRPTALQAVKAFREALRR